MNINVSEAEDLALDWMVAEAQGLLWRGHGYSPSTNWSQGGPIIEREGIELVPDGGGAWGAAIRGGDEDDMSQAPTPLIAAMRCFVSSRLGGEVEVPDELARPETSASGSIKA